VNDPNIKESYFERNADENKLVGIVPEESGAKDSDLLDSGPCSFPTKCSACSSNACETNMQIVNIPFFKDILIMSTTCERCGFKSNEVKSAGQISEKGKRLTLSLMTTHDLSRDILKSDSCSLEIPEIELKLETGTLGSRFTTIEGLLTQVHNELKEKCAFALGDSASDSHGHMSKMLKQLEQVRSLSLMAKLDIHGGQTMHSSLG
jgi:zinc finger protein ZPR1